MIMDYANKVKTTPESDERAADSALSASPGSLDSLWPEYQNRPEVEKMRIAKDMVCFMWGVFDNNSDSIASKMFIKRMRKNLSGERGSLRWSETEFGELICYER